MYNIIYVILGIYFGRVIIIKLMEYKKKQNKNNNSIFIRIKEKVKLAFNQRNKEKNNIFIFKAHKQEGVKGDLRISHNKISNKERQQALEKAKYKCQYCGNIANLGVYNSENEVEVLCKKCYEEKAANMKLHYE